MWDYGMSEISVTKNISIHTDVSTIMKKSLIYWHLILCNQDIYLYNIKAGIHFAVSDKGL